MGLLASTTTSAVALFVCSIDVKIYADSQKGHPKANPADEGQHRTVSVRLDSGE